MDYDYKRNGNVIGEIYEMDGEIEICERGFHYCPKLVNCFNYYGFIQLGYRYESSKLVYSAGLDIPFKTTWSNFEQVIGLYPKVSVGYRFW